MRFSTANRFIVTACLLLIPPPVRAAEEGLRARLLPGQVLTYQFEGHFSFVPDGVDPRLETDLSYRGPKLCDYYFSTLIELRILRRSPDNTPMGEARYVNPTVTQWQCADLERAKAENGLQNWANAALPFSINERGEIIFPPLTEERLDFRGPFRLLTSSTLDLLHTVLSTVPVSAGQEWKPRESFVYWKEYTDSGLELSASAAKYERDVNVAGDNCAQIDFKYVLAPQDLAASASTSNGTVRAEYAGSLSTGSLQISALLDRTTAHLAWVHRSREIDNRLYLGRSGSGAIGTLTRFRLIEESTVRQLRQDLPLQWSASLKGFESGGVSAPRSAPDESDPLMRASAQARLRRRASEQTQQVAPAGYIRYEKRLCSNTWSCSVVSIALPGSVEMDDDSPLRVTFLATSSRAVASINIGPDQMKLSRGLTDDEELRKSALAFLAGKMWLRAGPGTARMMNPTYVGDYPGLLTEFTTSRIDGVQMEGKLVSVLAAWGEIVSIGCAYSVHDAATQEPVCQQVLDSIRVHQLAP